MAHKLFLLSFFILPFFLICCNSVEPPPPEKTITLTLEDVSCIEAWIKLTTTNLQLPTAITLKQNSQTISTINLDKTDTLLYIDFLLPNTNYTFQVSSIQSASGGQVSSNELSVATLDTTSQNFTFETLEFGDGYSSSYFNDVWIFNQSNIWAVGYIGPSDTTVNGIHITNPNIIKWDGISWKLQPFSGTSSGIYGIWAIDTSLIYFANGIVVKYQNGNYQYENFNNVPLANGQAVHKLWGSSENNIWGVGSEGTVVHYNGSSWRKIEFDTQWRFKEVTGNPETGTAYAVARNISFTTILVELKSNTEPEIIYNSDVLNISIDSNTLMIVNKRHLYMGLKQIGRFDLVTRELELHYQVPPLLGITEMSNIGVNDMYYFGTWVSEGMKMLHYNGIRYSIFELNSNTGIIYGGSHTINGITVLGGMWNNRAFLIKVKRN